MTAFQTDKKELADHLRYALDRFTQDSYGMALIQVTPKQMGDSDADVLWGFFTSRRFPGKKDPLILPESEIDNAYLIKDPDPKGYVFSHPDDIPGETDEEKRLHVAGLRDEIQHHGGLDVALNCYILQPGVDDAEVTARQITDYHSLTDLLTTLERSD